MAYQIPRFKSKRLVSQLKLPRLCLQTLMVGLCMVALSICSVQTAICSASVSTSAATTTEQSSFSGYTTEMFGVAVGQMCNSLYYLYRLTSGSYNAAVRKVDESGSQIWMASFAFDPDVKSLSVDASERSVYLAVHINPLVVLKLSGSTGSITSQHQL